MWELIDSEGIKTQSKITYTFQITAAIVHTTDSPDITQDQGCNSGSSLGSEKIPEENVRIIEDVEHHHGNVSGGHLQNGSVFPGTQRKKLYFNPAYFERQLLKSPPPAAVEFLMKIREVISIAKHKIATKKFVPSLMGKDVNNTLDSNARQTTKTKQKLTVSRKIK